LALKNEWAEQHLGDWWKHACNATQSLLAKNNIQPKRISGIGISYQMHGLVLVDKDGTLFTEFHYLV